MVLVIIVFTLSSKQLYIYMCICLFLLENMVITKAGGDAGSYHLLNTAVYILP